MGKKNKKKNNNNSGSNKQSTILNKNLDNVVIKSDSESIILTETQRQAMQEYCIEKKQEADKYYEAKKEEADLLSKNCEEKVYNSFNEEVEKKVSSRVKKELENIKDKEQKLLKDIEDYTKKSALLENEKSIYKKEQLEIIQNEMKDVFSEKNDLENKNKELLQENERLKVIKEAIDEDIKDLREQMKINAKNNGNNNSQEYQVIALKEEIESTKKLYIDQSARCDRLSSLLLKCGDNPEKIINYNSELEHENTRLKDVIAKCPSNEEIIKLRDTKNEYDLLLNKYEHLSTSFEQLEAKNEIIALEMSDINNKKSMIELLKAQKEELENELNKTLELYKNNVDAVFATLSSIDDKTFGVYDNNDNISLKDLCQKFRGYLANRKNNPLYYDEITIRSFIAGLASSRTMILEGLSGTGKTRLPMSFQDFAGVKVKVIPVQSSWKDRNDLLGYYNDFKKQYKETEFLKDIYRASCDPNNIYIIVLDEMNLSRVEYYFADFLSVLEKDENEWEIDLISDYASIMNSHSVFPKRIHEGKLKIGNNVWFVGTANKDDSTFAISDKVYDRSTVLYFDKKGEKFSIDYGNPLELNKDTFIKLINSSNYFKNQTDSDKCMKIIQDLDKKVKNMFDITFGNRIENQIKKYVPTYVECGGSIEEALDTIFSRKILRKLEGVYDENTKEKLEELREYLFETYRMPLSLDKIDKLIETK